MATKQPRRTYTEKQRKEALQIYQTDGLSHAAKITGFPKGTISSWAKRADVQTVRNVKTKEATETRIVDATYKRANVINQTITLAETLLTQLGEDLADKDAIPPKDKAVIFGILADKHRTIAGMEQGTENYNSVDAWVEYITNN